MNRPVDPNCGHSPVERKTGGCGHAGISKPTDMLSAEHRVIERVLDVIERLATQPVADSLEHWNKVLDFLTHFADQCHHLKEEQVLFPAMEEHGIPRDGGPIGVMLMEHEEGRSYVRSMKAALTLVEGKNTAVADSLVSTARAYVRLLREHIQKEDEILFRIADDVIPGRTDSSARIFQRARSERDRTGCA